MSEALALQELWFHPPVKASKNQEASNIGLTHWLRIVLQERRLSLQKGDIGGIQRYANPMCCEAR
jgi:hypothetical protein